MSYPKMKYAEAKRLGEGLSGVGGMYFPPSPSYPHAMRVSNRGEWHIMYDLFWKADDSPENKWASKYPKNKRNTRRIIPPMPSYWESIDMEEENKRRKDEAVEREEQARKEAVARRERARKRREELRKQKEQEEDDLLFHDVNETESGTPIVVGEVVQVVQAIPV